MRAYTVNDSVDSSAAYRMRFSILCKNGILVEVNKKEPLASLEKLINMVFLFRMPKE